MKRIKETRINTCIYPCIIHAYAFIVKCACPVCYCHCNIRSFWFILWDRRINGSRATGRPACVHQDDNDDNVDATMTIRSRRTNSPKVNVWIFINILTSPTRFIILKDTLSILVIAYLQISFIPTKIIYSYIYYTINYCSFIFMTILNSAWN